MRDTQEKESEGRERSGNILNVLGNSPFLEAIGEQRALRWFPFGFTKALIYSLLGG